MTIFEELKKDPAFDRKIALTIGNFEGYHIGHRAIVRTLKNEAKKQNLLTCIITFKNHPLKLLRGFEPERLWSKCDKIMTFYREGIDILIYLDFTKDFAYQEPEEFLDLIKNTIDPSVICLGETFRFGRENKGDINIIRKYGKKFGWDFLEIKDLEMLGAKVSSTRIRSKIKIGDFKTVNTMLGRKYSIYLESDKNRNNIMKLFIDNMAIPDDGAFTGEMIDLKEKDYYATRVRLRNGLAEIIDENIKSIIRRGSLYSFNFDSEIK